MNNAIHNDIQSFRRLSRMTIRSKQRYLVLQQQAGPTPNNSPTTVQAEIEKRLLAGKTSYGGKIDLTDLDLRGVDASKLVLDKCDLSGVAMDSRTKIGRAVGASFDGCAINSTKFVGDINGSSFVGAKLEHVTASEINASGCNFSSTIQFSNNFAGSNMAGTKWIKANAACNSYENADLAGALFERGEQTQCMFDGANLQNAKLLNTGLERASLDRINGTQMELRPAAREEGFSMCGAHLERAKLNVIAAAAAELSNATVKDCRIVHDVAEPKPAEKPFAKRFAALDAAHKAAVPTAGNDDMPVVARRPSLRLPTPGMSLLLAGLAA